MPDDPTERMMHLARELASNAVDIEIRSRVSPQELKARLKREAEDSALEREQKRKDKDHERRKDGQLFVISMVITSASAFAGLLSLFLFPATSAWAAPMLMLIVGGLVGYQTAKNQPPKNPT